MIGLMVGVSLAGFLGIAFAIVAAAANNKSDNVLGATIACICVIVLVLMAVALGGRPTGEELGLMPSPGSYEGKVTFIDVNLLENSEIYVMVKMPPRKNGVHQDPMPIKTYRVSEDRFLNPEDIVPTAEIKQVVVGYSAEHDQDMIEIMPCSP